MRQNNTIFICAGEASGDVLGASVAKELHQLDPTIKINGMGGDAMRNAGVNTIIDCKDVSAMGITAVIANLRNILRAKRTIKKFLRKERPELIILIDFADFNLRLAKIADGLGIKVLFYVSPKVWVWRKGRIKKIKKYVDHMALLFPFEKKIYDEAGVPATFVGHPMVQNTKPSMSRDATYEALSLNQELPIVGLFPGSRRGEIRYLLPIIIEACLLIKKRIPLAQFALPVASTINYEMIETAVSNDIHLITEHNYELMNICTAAIATSGTVTLELGLFAVPMIVIYKFPKLTYWMARILIRSVKYFGLCNIIAEKEVAKELLQDKVTAEAISEEICHIIEDETYGQQKRIDMACIRDKLDTKNSAKETAELAICLMAEL